MKVLIVEDDAVTRELIGAAVAARGHQVVACAAAEEAWELVQQEFFPLVILDWVLPEMDGLEFCRKIRALQEEEKSIVTVATAQSGEEHLRSVLEAGADDYLSKPIDAGLFKVRMTISEQRAMERAKEVRERRQLKRLISGKFEFHDLVGKSRPMQLLYQQAREVAGVDLTVLIEGETGTGKELIARAIHQASHRRDGPFIAVNCAGLNEALIGSQLFGHRRGAFTGAIENQLGLLEAAGGGTLLLDEIGDVPMGIQASLLRVLQEKEVTRLGETSARKVDVRILAATNRDLTAEVERGAFRQDLLYRLRVRISMPPLRQRREDIPLLVSSFLREVEATSDRGIEGVDSEAMGMLMEHPWPGNVREFKSAVEFAALHCSQRWIRQSDLPPEISPQQRDEGVVGERERIVAALQRYRGKRAAAARSLGMSRSTFYRRLRSLQIE